MSKLYTKEQMIKAFRYGKTLEPFDCFDDFIESLTPIQLPTDEEIVKQSKYIAHNYFEMHHANHYQGLEEGSLRMASWMLDKIKGGQDNE